MGEMVKAKGARRHRAAGLAVALVGALALTTGLGIPAVAAPTFPSWGDVQKAAQNVTTKQAEIQKISGLLAGLQAQSAAQGKVALIAGENYLNAQDALNTASQRVDSLQARANGADSRAKKSEAQAGQLAAQLARTGGSDLTLRLLLDGKNAGNLLDSLGAATKLGETSAAIFAKAEQDRNTARSLASEARAAQGIQSQRASQAQELLSQAQAKADAAQRQLHAQSADEITLTAQLASLKGTSADVEAQYVAGVAWEKAQAAVKTPPKDIPLPPAPVKKPTAPTGGAPAPSTPVSPTGPAPVTQPTASLVAGAIAFAREQLGKPYLLNGSGPGAWDCSGLTKAAYASVGVYIGTHSATNQYSTMLSEGRLVPLSQREAGDLLWYSNGGSPNGTKYHVALYIGNGQMIEAPYPGVNVRVAAVRYGDLVPYAGRPTG